MRFRFLTVVTVGAFLLVRRALTTGEEHFGDGTPIGHVHIQPGQRDGVLDDGGNGGGRRGEVTGCISGSIVGSPPDLPERPGEERSDLAVGGRNRVGVAAVPVGRPSVVAQEGCVAEHVAAAAHVHGVAEVAQRRADHVHREVAFDTAPAVGDQASEAGQLFLKIHDPGSRNRCPETPLIPQKQTTSCSTAAIPAQRTASKCLSKVATT